MVNQLEGSVLTAIALVMIVVLASLGTRSALLVGFAIPTSFLLCFILLGLMGISISNIVMFGLILAAPPNACSGRSFPPPPPRFAPSCPCSSGPAFRVSSWACCPSP